VCTAKLEGFLVGLTEPLMESMSFWQAFENNPECVGAQQATQVHGHHEEAREISGPPQKEAQKESEQHRRLGVSCILVRIKEVAQAE
jgi:hypothetical protein